MRRTSKAGWTGFRSADEATHQRFSEGVDSGESYCRMRLPDTEKRELAGSIKQVVRW